MFADWTDWLQSCPRATFLGPDPNRPGKQWPDPTRDCWPDPRQDPSPIWLYSLYFNNNVLISELIYIEYHSKSINPNVVFEDSYRFRHQEIISKKWTIRSADPTRQNRDPTEPDPTRPTGLSDLWTTLFGCKKCMPTPSGPSTDWLQEMFACLLGRLNWFVPFDVLPASPRADWIQQMFNHQLIAPLKKMFGFKQGFVHYSPTVTSFENKNENVQNVAQCSIKCWIFCRGMLGGLGGPYNLWLHPRNDTIHHFLPLRNSTN